MTAAVALQVFLRLPRDPERFSPEEAADHRQFWAPIATLVAVGSAFLIISIVADGLISSSRTQMLDLAEVIGFPLIALIALIFASDAVSLAFDEARAPAVAERRRKDLLRSLEHAVAGIGGTARKRPAAALVAYSVGFGGVFITLGTFCSWFLLGQNTTTGAYVVLTSMATIGLIIVTTTAVNSVLRGKILEAIFQILLPVLGIISIALQSVLIALPYAVDLTKPAAYLPGLTYGVLMTMPPFATVSALALVKTPRHHAAPLLSLAKHQMNALIANLEKTKSTQADRDTWELLSGSAILLGPVPFLALAMAAAATWHRRRSSRRRPWLFFFGWGVPVVLMIIEIAAMILLPYYGPPLGWFELK